MTTQLSVVPAPDVDSDAELRQAALEWADSVTAFTTTLKRALRRGDDKKKLLRVALDQAHIEIKLMHAMMELLDIDE